MNYPLVGLIVTIILATYLAGLFSGWYISNKSREAFKSDIQDLMRGYKPVEPTENEKILEKAKPGQPTGPPEKKHEYVPTQGRGNFKQSLSS